MSEDSDETKRLLKEVEGGNRVALDHLLDRHRAVVRAFVAHRLDARLLPRVDPSDIVQETQAETFRRIDGFLARRPMPFRAWVLRTARQHLHKAQRRHQQARRDVNREFRLPEKSSLDFARDLLARSTSPSRNMHHQELAQRLKEALARLSPTDREIVVMRNFEGNSNTEIGHLLGLTAEAVSKRYGRALLRLHRILSAEES
jgi:RNA polymerase sigma-70 factor (ECF subfamily)